jgi:DNA-binding beta-propeller fold protein YncE
MSVDLHEACMRDLIKDWSKLIMRVPMPVSLALLLAFAAMLSCHKIHSKCISRQCTIINAAGPVITDAAGNKWRLSGFPGQVVVNGAIDPTTANVIELVYSNSLVYQQNSARLWWSKTSPTARWLSTSQPLCPSTTAVVSTRTKVSPPGANLQHLEYVAQPGKLFVYNRDHSWVLFKSITVPVSDFIRGMVANSATGNLYIMHGGDGGRNGNGSLLAWKLSNDTQLYSQSYNFGVDSAAISNDGTKMYFPQGELAGNGTWVQINPSNGSVVATIRTSGTGPHNTVLNGDDSLVFFANRFSNNLIDATTSNNSVLTTMNAVANGVRPFTINKTGSIAYVTTSETSGTPSFYVISTSTGAILYQPRATGLSCTGGQISAGIATCTHGIALSPDERTVYLIDAANSANHIHVFDASGVPSSAPTLRTTWTFPDAICGSQSPCAGSSADCLKEGWLHLSMDGRYLFVGDSGDVIDTTRGSTVANLSAMANSRVEIEVDMQKGKVVAAMNQRNSIGQVDQARTAGAKHVQGNY